MAADITWHVTFQDAAVTHTYQHVLSDEYQPVGKDDGEEDALSDIAPEEHKWHLDDEYKPVDWNCSRQRDRGEGCIKTERDIRSKIRCCHNKTDDIDTAAILTVHDDRSTGEREKHSIKYISSHENTTPTLEATDALVTESKVQAKFVSKKSQDTRD